MEHVLPALPAPGCHRGLISVGRLRGGDRASVLEVFEGMSERSRRLRFHGPKPRLREADVDRLVDVGCCGREAVAAIDLVTGAVVGTARFVRDHDDPRSAEVAFEVVDQLPGTRRRPAPRRRAQRARSPGRHRALPRVGRARQRARARTSPERRSTGQLDVLRRSLRRGDRAGTGDARGVERPASLRAMRIVAGSRKGPRDRGAEGRGDAGRPAIASARPCSRSSGRVEGARVLDLFAGSGAMGLEALSRGAAQAVFVERDRDACRVIQRNLEKLRLTGADVRCQRRPRGAARRRARAAPATTSCSSTRPTRSGSATRSRSASCFPTVLAEDGLAVVETRCASVEPSLPLDLRHEPPLRFRTHHASSPDDQRNLPRLVRPRHERARRRHPARGVDLRPGGRRRRSRSAAQADALHRSRSASRSSRARSTAVENVVVDVFSELVVDFARKHSAQTMVKGLRVISDFEWEFQMNHLNRQLAPEIETVYVMASPLYSFVSSSGVKEIASFGGKVDELVPPAVARRFAELYPDGRPGAPRLTRRSRRRRPDALPSHLASRLSRPWTYSCSSTSSTTSCTTRRPSP